jgi:hypothetical protein
LGYFQIFNSRKTSKNKFSPVKSRPNNNKSTPEPVVAVKQSETVSETTTAESKQVSQTIKDSLKSTPSPQQPPQPQTQQLPTKETVTVVSEAKKIATKPSPVVSVEPKDKELISMKDKGVRKLVDVYENKPQQPSPSTTNTPVELVGVIGRLNVGPQQSSSSSSSNNETNNTTTTVKKLPKSIYEKYEPSRVEEATKRVINEQHGVPTTPSEQPKLECSNVEQQTFPEVRVFHSESSDLCAVVHIPNVNDVPLRKQPKIRCVLRVDSDEPLIYNISTASGRKVPFKVRHRSGKSIAVFSYHRVVDFNVAIESQTEFKQPTYKAQLEGILKMI